MFAVIWLIVSMCIFGPHHDVPTVDHCLIACSSWCFLSVSEMGEPPKLQSLCFVHRGVTSYITDIKDLLNSKMC